jgi:RNA polymerase sigma factor (TIGR02999 family)
VRFFIPPPSPKEISLLLVDWSNGNKSALDELMPLVYNELRRLASNYLKKERHNHTLQSAALVNEAYLRLVDYSNLRWQDRVQFFGLAAQLMRRILIDHARSRHYAKRGGGAHQVSLGDAAVLSEERASDLVALDDALRSLAAIDLRKAQVVELRFFGGLNIEETAEVLKISSMTIQREWRWAKAYLHREMSTGNTDDRGTLAESR